MYPELPKQPTPISDQDSSKQRQLSSRQPRTVFDSIFAFPPNRDTLGATAYLIVENAANILIDCPAWDEVNQRFLEEQGGIRWLFLTHRDGIGKVRDIQQAFNCEVVIQEQEAYLLPNLDVTRFHYEFNFSSHSQAIWTSGHSPGTSCLYHDRYGGVLFSGRHLLPDLQGAPIPLRIAKTFHWARQIQNVQRLRDRFSPETLSFICPGANTGFLRGKRTIEQAYQRLAELDLERCLQAEPLL